MDPRIIDEVSISDLFDQFIEASTMRNVLSIHHRIMNYSDLNPCEFNIFFPKLKRAVMTNRANRKNWKAKALFSKIDKRAAHRCYSNTKVTTPLGIRTGDNPNSSLNSQEYLDENNSSQSLNRPTYYSNNALQHYNCLVIGSGPAGLRTAIELQLLGASRVVVVEKRGRFSRNNVLHLWPFVIDDLKSLGAKKFYGKFCAGSIEHISIRQLQLMLLKICLMIGCDFRDSCSYLYLCPSSIKQPKQVTIDENNSDNKKANGASDNTESSIKLKCDLDVMEPLNLDNFVKFPVNTTEENDDKQKQSEVTDSASEQNSNSIVAEDTIILNHPTTYHGDPTLSTNQPENIPISPDLSKQSKTPLIQVDDQNRGRGENLQGARAHFQSEYQFQEKELHSHRWDFIIGADGRRNTLSKYFPRKEFRGRLAIAITANFINRQTPTEAAVPEISGLSFIYNQDMFNALAYDTNIQLENICYYKDDTHYFVMTAKKKSLLERGVLINDYAATQDLLSDDNVDKQALLKYAKDAAFWTTGLEPLDFALNHYGQEDCAMFDFTSMYAASNACKALRTKEGGLALISLVGDSLLEPFWPTGSGCARGFLSAFDAAWMCRQWAVNRCAVIDHHNSISSRSSRNRASNASDGASKPPEPTTYNRMALSVIAERESIHRILAQTTSENLQQNYPLWTLNPHSRYPNLNRHLVLPSQVEHLISDNDTKISSISADKQTLTSERLRRNKSPNNVANSRKSPKKLKSATTSPLTQARSTRAKSLTKQRAFKSRSRHDLTLDDTYLKFEESYRNLADYQGGPTQYLNHRRPDCSNYDDLFIPSISGTLPSSNNLLNLEARRARDIDDCLRQRRQRTQLSVVRDQLIEQFKGDKTNRRDSDNVIPGGAALFNELKRLKEQQSKGKENRPKDVNGPLTLLNSIRRCASFAERVKSFESKLSYSSQESNPNTPKTPIDNVRNLPQFATLHELFLNNSTLNTESGESVKKSKIPITTLSKDDWNVKCWEKRLSVYKQKNARDFGGSTKSLNKAVSVDRSIFLRRPDKQMEVFKDRIKEMADKLEKSRDVTGQSSIEADSISNRKDSLIKSNVRSQGWVSHLRRKLINGVESSPKQAMNPSAPNKPIKKLFADDEDDDGIDVNKHYDHLCLNRPTNKYLPKNGYISHLTRTKYNSTTSNVINRKLTTESKQAYVAKLTSRGSSASSTLSDYSTNTIGSSSGSGGSKPGVELKCFRCKKAVLLSDRITIGGSALHRNCLTCANCGITLRTNEIHHYLSQFSDNSLESQDCRFICAICKPNIRADLTKEAANRLAHVNEKPAQTAEESAQNRLRSREEFLNGRVNYNELYKNILTDNMRATAHFAGISNPHNANNIAQVGENSACDSAGYSDNARSNVVAKTKEIHEKANISPSPVSITLPIELISKQQLSDDETLQPSDKASNYRIARSETIDGSEQVTLMLPSTSSSSCERANVDKPAERAMIDEEELERILHLDTSSRVDKSCIARNEDESSEQEDSSDENKDEDYSLKAVELSDDPSSLNSPPNTEDYDSIDENHDPNSTYEDFITSEEFGASSDHEDADDRGSLSESNVTDNKLGELQGVGVSGEQ